MPFNIGTQKTLNASAEVRKASGTAGHFDRTAVGGLTESAGKKASPSTHFKELKPEQLYNRCEPGLLKFKTTAELEDLTGVLGQTRAVGAIHFGIGIQREGYNLYAMGPAGSGKHSIVRRFLDQQGNGKRVLSVPRQ